MMMMRNLHACGLMIIAAINSHCFFINGVHHLVLVLLRSSDNFLYWVWVPDLRFSVFGLQTWAQIFSVGLQTWAQIISSVRWVTELRFSMLGCSPEFRFSVLDCRPELRFSVLDCRPQLRFSVLGWAAWSSRSSKGRELYAIRMTEMGTQKVQFGCCFLVSIWAPILHGSSWICRNFFTSFDLQQFRRWSMRLVGGS
jgi:hypothetical protein